MSGTSNISNITLNANVSSVSVTSLTSVNVYGNFVYNTNINYNIQYINSYFTLVKNNGSGIINIKKINTTISDQTDAELQPYVPTYITITNILDGYIAIYDNNSTQQYYNLSNGTIELPYSANGTWSYKIARYGYKLITGSFTVNRTTGGTVTINPIYIQDIYVSASVNSVSAYNLFSTTQNIYDYLSYYRTTSAGLGYGDLNSYISTLDIGSNNIIIFDSASQTFSYNGSTFTLRSSSLSGAAIKTTGTISISGNSSISDIELTTNVLDQTPNDLTNVTINGILSYNTNSPASIVYTNTTVSTVVNDGTGIVLIERINSTINNATDPQILNYAPTIINVTPNGGSVAIYNNLGVRQYFITTNSTVVLPYDATGIWSYRVAKYAYYSIYQEFEINSSTGSTVNINPNSVSDLFISEPNVVAVSTYTDLTSPDKIHDYLSYFQTLSSGIDYGDLENESFGTIVFISSLTLDATAASMVNYSSGTLTLKSTSLVGSTVVSVNGNFVQANGNTISDEIKIRASNIDSEIYFNAIDYVILFPSTIDRDSNINGNITISSTIYRYKYGSTVSGILLRDNIYAKISTGGTTLLVASPIETGSTYLDYGTTGNFQLTFSQLRTINTGVQKASKLIPHTTTF